MPARPRHVAWAERGRCPECAVGHAVVVCVGLVTVAVGAVRATRPAARLRGAVAATAPAAARVRRRRVVDRPPEPAWIRLSVIRC